MGLKNAFAWNDVLLLSEDELEAIFPNGAKAVGNKWRPANEGEEPDRPLGQLVKERWKLRDVPRLMPRDPTKPPTSSSVGALGAHSHDTETALGESLPPEPEMVDEESLARITTQAHARFAERQQKVDAERTARDDTRRFAARYKAFAIYAVRCGADPTRLLADFERQLSTAEQQLKKAS